MRCSKAHRWISEYMDGALDAAGRERLEKHLAGCGSCRGFLEDLRAVARESANLAAPPTPEGVWPKIRARLPEEGKTDASPAAIPRPAAWYLKPGWRYATASLAAVLLIAGGFYLGLRRGGLRSALPAFDDQEEFALAKLDEAERYYLLAIKSLSEAFAARKGEIAPQVAEMFEANLAVIDTTIKACRQAVVSEPDDLEARNYLLAAYKEKISFLDNVLGYEKRSSAQESGGKAL